MKLKCFINSKGEIMQKVVDISVVIPVYGCRNALEELCERIVKVITHITNSYEIILVEDNCPQKSWESVKNICEKNKNVVGVHLSRNFGQMKAILAGLDISRGEWVVVMDCDLQDLPEDIENLYNKAKEGYDIVFSRRKNRHDSKIKVAISKMFYKIYSWISDDCYDPAISNYCICNRKVINSYCKMREWHRAFIMYLRWLGFNSTVIDVNHSDRKEGKSSYSMKKRIKLALDILISQSDKVLKVIVKTGFFISFISFAMGIVTFARYFMYNIKSGWTSIILVLLLMGGLILMAIGCVGLYVGNIFMQCKQRPLYVVNESINLESEEYE